VRKWIIAWRRSSVVAWPAPWRRAISLGGAVVFHHDRMVDRQVRGLLIELAYRIAACLHNLAE
jgi:hypothetical protein